MQKFFNDLHAIERFTSTLKSQSSLQCQYCTKTEHFISHGYVYKQHSIATRETVGKRIVCCNRYGHQGCGRTYQLDIVSKLPKRRYSNAVLFTFISLLLFGHSVCHAYAQATKQSQTRHAWRWLKKLNGNIMSYRGYLKRPIVLVSPNNYKHHHLLLTTLASLVSTETTCPCSAFQCKQQIAFI